MSIEHGKMLILPHSGPPFVAVPGEIRWEEESSVLQHSFLIRQYSLKLVANNSIAKFSSFSFSFCLCFLYIGG